jgi:hypothetical protein
MNLMLVDVVEARAVGGHRLFLRFADGVAGEVDVDRLVRWEGVFEPLRDPKRFAQVEVDVELDRAGLGSDGGLKRQRSSGRPSPSRLPRSAA